MSILSIPDADAPYIDALRSLIRTGATAAPHLDASPLIELPVVLQRSGPQASATKRGHMFITVLQHVIVHRLEGNDAHTAAVLFGLGEYAGIPLRERYKTVAELYNPYWTWENFRKEPLTRHLLSVYLALKREAALTAPEAPTATTKPTLASNHSARKVLIAKNITREGPGLLARILDEAAIGYDVVDLSQGDDLPDPTTYAALIILGGPDSANDPTPKIQRQLNQIRTAFDAGVPYLGVCLGLQLAVKAMGGHVVQSPVKEIGLHAPDGTPYSVSLTDLALTALGRKDPLFLGLRNHFRVFQLHGETVELTPGMQLLATGKDCHNQIVKLRRNAYGIQSHFELTRPMLIDWLREDPDLHPLDEQKILDEFDAIEEVYTITGLSVLRNFLHIAGFIS